MNGCSSVPIHVAIPDEAARALFRVMQGEFNNALQFADASEIAVRLTITDDGRGIAGNIESARFVAQKNLGLARMRERRRAESH
jgi:signal transduction histidine kinase